MTSYGTTRGGASVDLGTAVLNGLAPDGGLYVPDTLPRLDGAPPAEGVIAWVAASLFPSLPAESVGAIAEAAIDFPLPLVPAGGDRYVLELFHGPTHAFKDVGARFMAGLMEVLAGGDGPNRTILVATSGDTGGAVASAFHDRRGVRVVVLFPGSGVSDLQRRQMTTLGGNVQAIQVHGTFDDCQSMVKAAFRSEPHRTRHALTSANSINVARLLPQAIYYVVAATSLSGGGQGWPDTPPRFFVPSGNLGNLCAGLIAARAGMPTAGFVAATNANRGFADFLGGADFEARPSIPTRSNAMDVGDPSNLERIRWLYHLDDALLRRDVRGDSVDDAAARACMRRTYEETGYVLDPHSAVAFEAASRHDPESGTPRIVLSTAHPGKFPDVVEEAIGRAVPPPPGLALASRKAEHMTTIEADPRALFAALDRGPA